MRCRVSGLVSASHPLVVGEAKLAKVQLKPDSLDFLGLPVKIKIGCAHSPFIHLLFTAQNRSKNRGVALPKASNWVASQFSRYQMSVLTERVCLCRPPKPLQKQGCGLANSQGVRSGCFTMLKVLSEASERVCTLEERVFLRPRKCFKH